MKKSKAQNEETATYIKEIENRLQGVISLLIECMKVNKISHSDMVSAMTALIVSFYSSHRDPNLFYRSIDAMKEMFEIHRREQ